MDPIQVAMLVLAALVVGMLIPVMVQIWLTLKQVQQELRATQAKLDPLLEEMRSAVTQVRNVSNIASAVSLAVSAGIHAWRETRNTKDSTAGSSPDTP